MKPYGFLKAKWHCSLTRTNPSLPDTLPMYSGKENLKKIVICKFCIILFLNTNRLRFMERNGILYRSDGSKRIADNTLVAITLMIAESRTEEKDIMVKVVVNLINQQNQ